MDLKKYIREIMDFPKQGVGFKDISPLLASPEAYEYTINELAKNIKPNQKIVSPDARGFLFGAPLAIKTKNSFVMVRKPGKLPGKTVEENYELEYGINQLVMQQDAIQAGDEIVIVDDVLATGGTVNAITKLIEGFGAKVVNILFVAELSFLHGKEKLTSKHVKSLIIY